MNSDDAPPSFASGAMSGFDQNELQSNATGDDFDYTQPPSHGDMTHGQGNSYNQFQTEEIVDDNKLPSLTDIRNAQGNSYNQDPNTSFGSVDDSNVSSTGNLSVSDMVKVNVSETSDGGGGSYKEVATPSYGDMGPRGASDIGPSPATEFDDPDEQELEGMSMVSNAFKNFRPNSYYKQEDDDEYY